MSKNKIKFEFVCTNCGKKLKPNSSNTNWNEISTICPTCGGKVDMRIKED